MESQSNPSFSIQPSNSYDNESLNGSDGLASFAPHPQEEPSVCTYQQRKEKDSCKNEEPPKVSSEEYLVSDDSVSEPTDDDAFIGVYAGKSQKGFVPYNPKKTNQDRMLVKEDPDSNTLVLGVFDGHGEYGHFVSEYICNSFYPLFHSHPLYLRDMKSAAIEALAIAEQKCIQNAFINTKFSGTTAVISIIRNNYLLTLNVGDSKAVIANTTNDARGEYDLTIDHKPDVPSEKERIINAGGKVFAARYEDGFVGPTRVWLPNQTSFGLAMSRSLCDTTIHSVGVVSTPDVYERTLTADDRMIILASDGLWEFLSTAEVVDIADEYEQPVEAVEKLESIARRRWLSTMKSVDDITIIVLFMER